MAKKAPISKRELRISVAIIISIMAIIMLNSILLLPECWYIWLIVLVCFLVAVGYFAASKEFYQCPSCRKAFKISALQDFFAPHGITRDSNGQLFEWKLLKCPQCKKREKCYRTNNKELK
jgi:hypothetical protein